MLTPIDLIKATIDGMIERKCGRVVNITSNSLKAPIELVDTAARWNGRVVDRYARQKTYG